MSDTPTVIFLDDLPKVSRTSEGGNSKYLAAAEQLRANPNQWGYITGPVAKPYGITNNLNQGQVNGVDPKEFEFTTRSLSEEQAKAMKLDPPTTDDDGEDVNGYVFGRHITGDVAKEVQAKREERRQKMAKSRAKNKATASK